MKLPTFLYSLYLRRVRILPYALFGVFIFCYAAVLKGETLTAWIYGLTEGRLLLSSGWFGILGVMLVLPLLRLAQCFLLPKVCDSTPTFSLHRTLLTLLAVCWGIGILTPSDEAQTLELKMGRLCLQEHYAEALSVGENFAHPTPQVVALRAYALMQLQRDTLSSPLADTFFDYPLPSKANAAMLRIVPTAATPYYAELVHRSLAASPALRRSRQQHLHWLGLLLDRKLSTFAEEFRSSPFASSHPETLPMAYREALVLYRRTGAQPFVSYTDATIEANYRDFLDLRQKFLATQAHSPIEEGNLLRSDYGQTYWHFYFYNSIY